jgi:hypothetical protein
LRNATDATTRPSHIGFELKKVAPAQLEAPKADC